MRRILFGALAFLALCASALAQQGYGPQPFLKAAAGGSPGQAQFNIAGALGGVSALTWNGTTLTITAPAQSAVNFTDAAFSFNGVPFSVAWFETACNCYDSFAFGQNAGANYSANLGAEETFIGSDACRYCTTALAQTAIGRDTLGARSGGVSVTGNDNTAVGAAAAPFLQGAAGFNTAIGTDSAYNVSTASDTTSVGYDSCFGNASALLTGTGNTCIGFDALYSVQGASQFDTGVGYQAGYLYTGSTGVFVGTLAGQNISTGAGVTCNGYAACQGSSGSPLTGTGLTAVGYQAGFSQAGAAQFNTDIGYQAGKNATSNNNTFVGTISGEFVSTGGSETCVGYNTCVGASGTPTTGNGLTAFGLSALANAQGAAGFDVALGYQAGKSITTGSSNVVIGVNVASTTLTTGQRNIIIGINSTADTPASGTNDYFAIWGNNAAPLLSGTMSSTVNALALGSAAIEVNGSLNIPGPYYVGGTAGVTSSTCTQWTGGICTHT